MTKKKKTDQDVVKKAEIEPNKNPVSALKVHITKPINEPKNKRNKSKEKANDGKKKAGGKTGIKQKPRTKNKPDRKEKPGKGEKTPVQRPVVKRQGILERILPPWF